MTTVQKNAIINPTSGLTVYDSTIEDLSVYTSSGWTGVITERDTLQIVTNRGNTTTNSIEYVGSEEAIRPSVDSVGTLGALNFQFGTVYSRAISSANNNLDITGSNVNLNDSSGNIKLRVFGSTGNVTIQNGGTHTDAGFRLDVNGTTRFQGASTFTGSTTASTAVARGVLMNNTLVAAANGDTLVGLDINPTFTNGVFTGVNNIALRVIGPGTGSTTTSLLVQNSGGTQYFKVADNGTINLGSSLTVTGNGGGVITGSVGGRMVISSQFDMAIFASGGGIGIGGTSFATNSSAMLEVQSITKGFLRPRMTTTQRDAIATPATGLTIYNTTTNTTDTYDGTSWQKFGQQTFIKGSGTTSATSSLLVQNSAATTALNINDAANVQIGTTTDAGFRLDVNGTTRFQDASTFTGSITASAAIARGVYMNQTLVAAANGDILVGLDINPTYTRSSFTGVTASTVTITSRDIVLDNTTTSGLIINASQTASGGSGGAIKYGLQIVGSGNFNRNIGTEVYGLNIPSYSGSVYGDREIGAYIQDRVAIGTYNPITVGSTTSPLLTIGNAVDYSAYTSNPNSIYLRFASPTAGITSGIYGGQSINQIQAGIFFTKGTSNGQGFIDFITSNTNATGTLNARMFGNGNLLIQSGGTFTDAGFRLDVSGNTRIVGTTTLLNTLTIGTGILNYETNPNLNFTIIGNQGIILNHSNGNSGGITLGSSTSANFTVSAGTTTRNGVAMSRPVTPISGTTNLQFNSLLINNVINFSAATTSIARGLFISPTLTSVPDFRAIETTVGNVIFGSTSGNVLIGSGATDIGVLLNVSGSGRFNSINVNTLSLNSATGNPIGAITGSFAGGSLSFYPIDQFANTWFNHTGNGNILFDNTSNDHVFRTNFTEAFIIKNNRNILIGTTTDAGYKLDVNGTARVQNSLTLGNLSGDPSGANGMIYYNTTTNKFRGYENGSWTNLI
jgi:hypothetical protein